MEIGWYLRFTRDGAIEALVDPAQVAQIEHAMAIVPGWTLSTSEESDHVRALLEPQPRK